MTWKLKKLQCNKPIPLSPYPPLTQAGLLLNSSGSKPRGGEVLFWREIACLENKPRWLKCFKALEKHAIHKEIKFPCYLDKHQEWHDRRLQKMSIKFSLANCFQLPRLAPHYHLQVTMNKIIIKWTCLIIPNINNEQNYHKTDLPYHTQYIQSLGSHIYIYK